MAQALADVGYGYSDRYAKCALHSIRNGTRIFLSPNDQAGCHFGETGSQSLQGESFRMKFKWLGSLLAIIGLLVASSGWAAEQRARAALVRGEVTALDEDGQRRLRRNDLVEVGELVRTGPKGLAQLVFPDRSMLYVKAGSELKLESFHFDPAAPDSDAAVTTLLKGGMRALSGMVGKRNPEKVRHNTRVSTIGIRGTALEINQGGPECLGEGAGGGCGDAADGWTVAFDFGEGWVDDWGGRVDLAQGQSLRIGPGQRPIFGTLERRSGDPAFIVRQLAGMDPSRIERWSLEQTRRLVKGDLYLAIAMFRQSSGFDGDRLAATVRGLSLGLSREERSELREFAVRIYPDYGARIMRSSTLHDDERVEALESVLRGMENADPSHFDEVYEQAIEGGMTLEEAKQVLEELRDNPLQCR
jgi:hypothetical protein